jgi:hypothetical protein
MDTLFWLAFIFLVVPAFWWVVYNIVKGFDKGGGSD